MDMPQKKEYRVDFKDKTQLGSFEEGLERFFSFPEGTDVLYIFDGNHDVRNWQTLATHAGQIKDATHILLEQSPVVKDANGNKITLYDAKTGKLSPVLESQQDPILRSIHDIGKNGQKPTILYDADVDGQDYTGNIAIGYYLSSLGLSISTGNKEYAERQEKTLIKALGESPEYQHLANAEGVKELLDFNNDLHKNFTDGFTKYRVETDKQSALFAAEQMVATAEPGKPIKPVFFLGDAHIYGGGTADSPSRPNLNERLVEAFNDPKIQKMMEEKGVTFNPANYKTRELKQENLGRGLVSGYYDSGNFYTADERPKAMVRNNEGKFDIDDNPKELPDAYLTVPRTAAEWQKNEAYRPLSRQNRIKTLEQDITGHAFSEYAMNLAGIESDHKTKIGLLRSEQSPDKGNVVLALAAANFSPEEAKRMTEALNKSYSGVDGKPFATLTGANGVAATVSDSVMRAPTYEIVMNRDQFNRTAYPAAMEHEKNTPAIGEAVKQRMEEIYTPRALDYMKEQREKALVNLKADELKETFSAFANISPYGALLTNHLEQNHDKEYHKLFVEAVKKGEEFAQTRKYFESLGNPAENQQQAAVSPEMAKMADDLGIKATVKPPSDVQPGMADFIAAAGISTGTNSPAADEPIRPANPPADAAQLAALPPELRGAEGIALVVNTPSVETPLPLPAAPEVTGTPVTPEEKQVALPNEPNAPLPPEMQILADSGATIPGRDVISKDKKQPAEVSSHVAPGGAEASIAAIKELYPEQKQMIAELKAEREKTLAKADEWMGGIYNDVVKNMRPQAKPSEPVIASAPSAQTDTSKAVTRTPEQVRDAFNQFGAGSNTLTANSAGELDAKIAAQRVKPQNVPPATEEIPAATKNVTVTPPAFAFNAPNVITTDGGTAIGANSFATAAPPSGTPAQPNPTNTPAGTINIAANPEGGSFVDAGSARTNVTNENTAATGEPTATGATAVAADDANLPPRMRGLLTGLGSSAPKSAPASADNPAATTLVSTTATTVPTGITRGGRTDAPENTVIKAAPGASPLPAKSTGTTTPSEPEKTADAEKATVADSLKALREKNIVVKQRSQEKDAITAVQDGLIAAGFMKETDQPYKAATAKDVRKDPSGAVLIPKDDKGYANGEITPEGIRHFQRETNILKEDGKAGKSTLFALEAFNRHLAADPKDRDQAMEHTRKETIEYLMKDGLDAKEKASLKGEETYKNYIPDTRPQTGADVAQR